MEAGWVSLITQLGLRLGIMERCMFWIRIITVYKSLIRKVMCWFAGEHKEPKKYPFILWVLALEKMAVFLWLIMETNGL